MSSPTYRPSRFIEGEPLTHAPSVATQPLFNSIMTEQDEHDQRRRGSDSHSTSVSPTTSNDPQEGIPRVSSSSLRGLVGSVRRSIEEDSSSSSTRSHNQTHRESTSEKIKGRLRALSSLTGVKGEDRRAQAKV